MKTIKVWFAILMFTIITFGFGVNIYFQYYPFHIIDIHSPLKILTPKVKQGKVVIYLLDYCLYKSYPITVSRSLVDGTLIELPTNREVLPIGCHQIPMQVPIPSGSSPGVYYINGIKSFLVTQTRKIDVSFTTDKFEITK